MITAAEALRGLTRVTGVFFLERKNQRTLSYSNLEKVPHDFVVTAPEVALQPVTQGMPPILFPRESSYPTVPQSDAFGVTAPEVASQPVTQGDASGVGRATGVDTVNSRVNCFAISLATWSPPIHPRASANLKIRTNQRAHLSVICRRTK